MADAKPIDTPPEGISIQRLWARYDYEPVLEDINLSVKVTFSALIQFWGPSSSVVGGGSWIGITLADPH